MFLCIIQRDTKVKFWYKIIKDTKEWEFCHHITSNCQRIIFLFVIWEREMKI